MDIADLKVFEAVARLGSMNRAALDLHTVQSNVTARIQALEEDLGVALFRRHARGVTPTRAGERMLPFVGRLTMLLAEARAAARDDGVPAGPLHLGSLETTAAIRVAPLLEGFLAACPEVQFSLTTGTTAMLLDEVIACRLDGAFVAGPVRHAELVAEPILREELVLVTPPTIGALAELPALPNPRTIVFRVGCSYRQRLDAFLSDLGIAGARAQELGSLDAIIACVAAGLGVTLLPRAVAAAALAEGRIAIHALPPERAKVETLFVRRRDASPSRAVEALLDLARRKGSEVR
ncbi:LysR family transcriptional regulator [Methylobacterium sp. JK268]